MPPVKSWTPPSLEPDDPSGARGAPAGYRPWPTSGRYESARVPKLRRPPRIDSFLKLVSTKKAVVGVIGLGYVGLPLVRLFASKGFRVLGFDSDPAKVKALNAGRSYIAGVPSETIARFRRSKKLQATGDLKRLAEADAIVICVPTPLKTDGTPDLGHVIATANAVAKTLRRGQLVILESTTYPGTTREVLKPILEATGLIAGRHFFLAFSPEREDPGRKDYTTETIPKVVGGITADSLKAASSLYRLAVKKVVEVSSVEVAEASKLLENIYRCVNIALVNELKMVLDRMGLDIWEVIAAAATKPFGFQPFYPGPGMGGHCIPIDPFYLSWRAKQIGTEARFIELAGRVNVEMPGWVVARIVESLGRRSVAGAKVLVLGIAYKRDVDDPRESPAFRIMELLQEKGLKVSYHDPYFPKLPKMRHYPKLRVTAVPLTEETLQEADAVVIVTDHGSIDYAWVAKHARLVIDTRHACKGASGKVVQA